MRGHGPIGTEYTDARGWRLTVNDRSGYQLPYPNLPRHGTASYDAMDASEYNRKVTANQTAIDLQEGA